jgi:nucleoporin NDC1
LTSDSKDPNGSLLNGLKNKKLSIKVCSRCWCSADAESC